MTKNKRPSLAFLNLFSQAINKAIAIKMNKAVQTGAKTQFGGAKLGRINPAYQESMLGVVKNAPIKPANWQMTIVKNKRATLGIIIEK